MPHYVILGNFTKKGIEKIEDAPKRDEEARRIIEEAGGSLQLFYTMGDYDFVAIMEMPDDESMLKFLLQTLRGKNVVMKTLKAWTEQQFGEFVSSLEDE